MLATKAVGGVSEMDPSQCIVSSLTVMWTPDKGRAKNMTYTNTHKRLLSKKDFLNSFNNMFIGAHKLATCVLVLVSPACLLSHFP